MPDPISASVIVCESVLTEKSGLLSAIRIMDSLRVPPGATIARFFALTRIHAKPLDFLPHVLQVRMVFPAGDDWVPVSTAPDHRFSYGYNIEKTAPGGFNLTTEFNIDLKPLGGLGTYYVQALLDGKYLNQCPITLRRW
jgi:hypothetical protein